MSSKGKPSNKPSDSSNAAAKVDIGIGEGSIVSSMQALYVVEKLLGEGGFGAVYRVRDRKAEKLYAMKLEKTRKDPRRSKLKMEVQILMQVQKERAEHSHFTQIIDKGKKPKYCFVVMTLVGKSLDDLKRMNRRKTFSMATGLAAALQCLEGLEDLHKFGIIHRDVKPANYAVGLGEKVRTVYILDFGIARKITKEDNSIKTPRSNVAFKGTVRFAPLRCHENKELSLKDDCESWFYLLLDITNPAGLPWRMSTDKNQVKLQKAACHDGDRVDMLGGLDCKDDLDKIFSYIVGVAYTHKVDYQFIYDHLKQAATSCKADLNAPFDWEQQEPEPSTANTTATVHTAQTK